MTDNALVHLDKNKPNKDIRRFLLKLFSDEEGIVSIATKTKTKIWKEFFYNWPSDTELIVDHLRRESLIQDVYVCPSLLNQENSLKESFHATQYVWVDFDGATPPPEKLREVNVPDPSIRVRSSESGHEHWYWKLTEFNTEAALIENVSRRLAYHFGGDSGGWDCVQFLRPPATIHHDSGSTVELIITHPNTYSLTDFNDVPEVAKVSADLTISDKEINVNDVMLKYAFPDDMRNLFMKSIPVDKKDEKRTDRSAALTKLTLYCIEAGMKPHETLAIIENADNRWGKFSGRRDQKKRLTDLIKYCIDRKQKQAPPVEDEIEDFPVYGFFDFLALDIKVEWIVENFIPKQAMMIITGNSGSAKTVATMQLGHELALGRKFLDWKITRPFRTIMFSMEMSKWEFYIRSSSMSKGYSAEEQALINENFLVVPLGHGINIQNAADRTRIMRMIEKFNPDGIFFDSLGSTYPGDLSDNAIRTTFEFVKQVLINNRECFAWFIHHVTKDHGTQKNPRPVAEDIFGSVYIRNHASVIIGMWKPKEDKNNFEMYHLKSWHGPSWNTQALEIKSEPRLHLSLTEIEEPITAKSFGFKDDTDDPEDNGASFFKLN